MDFFSSYRACIRKYAVFHGRARRSEYWGFFLFNLLVSLALSLLSRTVRSADASRAVSAAAALYSLFVLLPGLAVSARRLHDTGRSGLFLFLHLLPLAGSILLLVFFCTDGEAGKNRYGDDPKHQVRPADRPQDREIPAPGAAPDLRKPAERAFSPSLTVPGRKIRATCILGPCSGMEAEGEQIFVGRDAQQCQLVLPDVPGVSRVHCRLRAYAGMIEIRDLHSSYGTFLADGTRLEPGKPFFAQPGSVICLGSPDVPVSLAFVPAVR